MSNQRAKIKGKYKWLVTGGAGFIGSNIVESLIKQEQTVRVLDNFVTGKRENLSDFISDIEVIEGDLRDLETVVEATSGVDFILHQGALPSVTRSIAHPITTNEINIGGTLNILTAARKEGVKRVVYASSSSVYGENQKLPKDESLHPKPLSPYAISKYCAEFYCQNFYSLHSLETVILRYFNVFGPRQDETSAYAAVIPRFIDALLRGEPPVIYGDGTQSRDFTFVENVVEANILAAVTAGVSGGIFNIACGEEHNLHQLLEHLKRITGKDIEPVHTQFRPGDIKKSKADINKAMKFLKYQPRINFEEGLELAVKWFYKNKKNRNSADNSNNNRLTINRNLPEFQS